MNRWYRFAPLLLVACASGTGGSTAQPASNETGVPECVAIEIQNTSLIGINAWYAWSNSSPRSLGRIGLNSRRTFRLPFRNDQFRVLFTPDGSSSRTSTNEVLPQPGDRLEIVYRRNGPGPLRRVGVARC